MSDAVDDPRVPILRKILLRERMVDRELLPPCTVAWDDDSMRALLARLDAADPLRGPVEELRDKHPVVLYFGSAEDAAEFARVAGQCFNRPVTIKL